MKHKTVDYRKHPPGFIVTKTTMDILLKQHKSESIITLYIFYGYVSCWQETLQIKATTSYTAKGLGWSTRKVQRIKKELIALGLIEDVVKKDKNNVITGHYIHPRYFPTPDKSAGVASLSPKCLETGNNKCLDTHSRHLKDGDRKTIPSLFDGETSIRLYKIIKSHKNITYNTTKWPDIIRRLRQVNKISKARIKEVIKWYSKHIGEEYVPVVESAKSFRDKFTRLEDAMIRYNKKYYPEDEEAQEDKYDEHGHMIDNFY